jgi:primosomal protein N' (replication factor Y)
MYAEVVVDRPIIKRDRRTFVEAEADAQIPLPEVAAIDAVDGSVAMAENPLATTFHYHLPPALLGRVQPGHWVAVPFRSQQLPAIVVRLSQSAPIEETRPLAALLDPLPVLTPAQIELAFWLSQEFLTPLPLCLRYFLPPGSGRKPEWWLRPSPAAYEQATLLPAPAQILLIYLRQKKAIRLSEVDPAAAESLIAQGLAYREARLGQPRVGAKIDRTIELLIEPDEVEGVLPALGRPSKQAEVLQYLVDLADPLPALDSVLAAVGCSKGPVEALAERGWVELLPAQTLVGLSPGQRQAGPAQVGLEYLAQQAQPLPLEAMLQATGLTRNQLNELVQAGQVTLFEEPLRVTLRLEPARLIESIIQLRGSQKQTDVLRLLAEEDGPVWVGWVYAQTGANLKVLRDLAAAELITLDEARRWRDPLAAQSFALDSPPTMTPEQQAVWQELALHWQGEVADKRPVLLHGVTGSGKTEIYLRAMAAALRAGQGAIMLVPEITLAAQTVKRVAARFPGKVAVWHSALSPGERYDTWERVRRGELPLVVGPRSALFAPVAKLGLIVVDEEHEPVYKQRDRAPIFHAREAAIELGRLSQAQVILGSATPDIVTYRRAERGEYRLLELPNRILAHTQHLAVQQALLNRLKGQAGVQPGDLAVSQSDSAFVTLPLPRVEVVDLREELKAGNRSIFSRVLQEGISETLKRGEQVILFLNRRGAASFVLCRDCGYVMHCPRCDTNMTYHTSGELMVCHYCGHRQATPDTCPLCHSERIRFFGLGTQRVEDTVKAMFPQAQTIRWDWDTTRQRGSHDVFLQHFMRGQANVMIGTQMVAKGLDLPLVTLVGVISADTALYLPDYRAGERTFQLLMQVAGRAGRSPLGGRVIVQSYTPDQVPIEAAANHDYEGFYQLELAFRQEQGYPPFKRVALLLYSGPGPERSAAEAKNLAGRLRLHIERQGLPAVQVIGPTPAYVRRVNSQYRWQILLRAADPAAVIRPLLPLPQGWRVDIDPVTLL